MIDEFVVVYPNIESLHLENLLVTNSRARSDVDCLSSIRFKALTSLSLKGFHADEGTFLLPVNSIFLLFKSPFKDFYLYLC